MGLGRLGKGCRTPVRDCTTVSPGIALNRRLIAWLAASSNSIYTTVAATNNPDFHVMAFLLVSDIGFWLPVRAADGKMNA